MELKSQNEKENNKLANYPNSIDWSFLKEYKEKQVNKNNYEHREIVPCLLISRKHQTLNPADRCGRWKKSWNSKNYSSKRKDLEEEDQQEDERNVIL